MINCDLGMPCHYISLNTHNPPPHKDLTPPTLANVVRGQTHTHSVKQTHTYIDLGKWS